MSKNILRAALTGGVIASVIALGAGPVLGAAKPTKLRECGEIDQPGSYVLTRNVTTDGDCFVVTADDVTLDLGGWVITGTNNDRTGITDDAPRRNIAVRNGTITGFGTRRPGSAPLRRSATGSLR